MLKDVVSDRVLVLSLWIIVIALLWILIMLACSTSSYSALTGYVAVAGASFIFGACGIPMKSTSFVNQQSNAIIFAMYTSFGILLCSLPLLIYLLSKQYFVFVPWAIAGSVDIIVINYFAFHAVQLMGYAKAPAIWCSVGMVTAFLQGSVLFREPIHNKIAGYSSIPVLVFGVIMVILSQKKIDVDNVSSYEVLNLDDTYIVGDESGSEGVELSVREKNVNQILSTINDTDDTDEDIDVVINLYNKNDSSTENHKNSNSSTTAKALVFCFITGLCDGSLMAPYKLSQWNSDTIINKDSREDVFTTKLLPTFNYLASFGIASALVAITVFLLICAYTSLRQFIRGDYSYSHGLSAFLAQMKGSVAPGLLSGVLWAAANFMSVHSTAYLGMKIGFPLTQTCVIFNACWGILYFQEIDLSERRTLLFLCLGVCCVITGSYLLAVSG